MKVVLFCGGTGYKFKGRSHPIPKPLVTVGDRPIIWNIMKYYAHFGHKDFILCMGKHSEMIKDYFMQYRETCSNDFILTEGKKNTESLNSDIHDWRITFKDTGNSSNISMRLLAVKDLLKEEEVFLSNYNDGLTDLYLPEMIDWFMEQKDKTAALMTYKPSQNFHMVKYRQDGHVKSIDHIQRSGYYVNTGYLIFRQEIFDYIDTGEKHINEPFQRLIKENKLISWDHKGFWAGIDTYNDKQILDEAYINGKAPWEVWKQSCPA